MNKYKNIRFAVMDYFQGAALEYELDIKDLIILKWFSDYAMTGDMIHKEFNNVVYYQVKHQAIIDQLPILAINSRRIIGRRLQDMVNKQILLKEMDSDANGTYVYYAMGPLYKNLLYRNPNNTLSDFYETIERLNQREAIKLMEALSEKTQLEIKEKTVENPVESVDNQGVHSKVQGVKKVVKTGGALKNTGGQNTQKYRGGCTQKYTHNISNNTSNISNKHNILNNTVNNIGVKNIVKKSITQRQLEFDYLAPLYTKLKDKEMSQKETTRLKSLIRRHYVSLIELAIERSYKATYPMAHIEALIKDWSEKNLQIAEEVFDFEKVQEKQREEERRAAFLEQTNTPAVDPSFYYDWMNEE